MKVDTYFIAGINEDGTITTMPEMPEGGIEAARPVTNYDVYQTAKQIVEEFESSVLAQKVASTVIAMMNQKAPTSADQVKDALKERGINPDSK
jgi:hypothetical protein